MLALGEAVLRRPLASWSRPPQHVPQLPSRPLAQTGLGWPVAATALRSGGDATFDGRVAMK